MHIRSYLAGFLLIAVFIILPALGLAEDKAPAGDLVLSAEQQNALASLATFLADPPKIYLEVVLNPPQTIYRPWWKREYADELYRMTTDGRWHELKLGLIEGRPRATSWNIDLSCGEWTDNLGSRAVAYAVWAHPDGALPTGCPHADGTSHKGTITVEGDVVIGAEYDDYKSSHFHTGLYKATWTFVCTYSGSESGEGTCEIRGVKRSGINDPRKEPVTLFAIMGYSITYRHGVMLALFLLTIVLLGWFKLRNNKKSEK